MKVAEHNRSPLTRYVGLLQVVYDQSAVNALSTGAEGSQKVADLVALEVGNIGENMAIRRAIYLHAPPGAHVGTYVHSAGKGQWQGFPRDREVVMIKTVSENSGNFGLFVKST